MTIVHIIQSLSKGGAEKLVIELCNQLVTKPEVNIHLVSLRANNPDDPASFLNKLSPKVKYYSLNKSAGFELKALILLTQYLKKVRPDIVHTHLNSFEYVNLYRLINKKCNFYHTIHTLAPAECSNSRIKQLRKYFYKKKNHFPVVLSKICSESFRNYYGIDKAIIIENGSQPLTITEKYQQVLNKYGLQTNDNAYLLVNVGRVEKPKNQLLLCSAVQQINKEGIYKLKLVIIGQKQDEAIVQAITDLRDVNIELLGVKRNVADYIAVADAFCLSSEREGMPISLLEAMSMGKIPICTKVGGIPDIISEGINGFLANTTIESYYEALIRFVKYQNKEEIAQKCRVDFEQRFHINRCAQKHISLYKSKLHE